MMPGKREPILMRHYDPTELCAKAFRLALVAVLLSAGHATINAVLFFYRVPPAIVQTAEGKP